MPFCCTTILLLQSSTKVLTDNELKYLSPSNAGRVQDSQIMFLHRTVKVSLAKLFFKSLLKKKKKNCPYQRICVKMLLRFLRPIPTQNTSGHRFEFIFTQAFGFLVQGYQILSGEGKCFHN